MARSSTKAVLAAVVATVGAASALAISGFGGMGGVATACAQTVPTDTLPIPTLGPIDPACGGIPDTDRDGVFDWEDNCQSAYNPSQIDTDQDSGEPPYVLYVTARDPMTGGDTCDIDDDGDTVIDVKDNCRKQPNKEQRDSDSDGSGDVCDPVNDAKKTAGGGRPKLGSVARVHRVAEIQAGIAVPVRCSRSCSIAAELVVSDARAARRLRTGRTRRLARGAARLAEAGSTYVFVRVPRRALARIPRAGVRALLRLKVSDDAGSRTTLSRRIVIRR
jgi:hypothetical protein